MSGTRITRQSLSDPHSAIGLYIDSLLRDESPVEAVRSIAPLPRIGPPAPATLPHEAQPLPEPAPDAVEINAERILAQLLPAEACTAGEAARPAWAQEPYLALIFKVGGFDLAVPVKQVDGIVKWSDAIAPTISHHPRALGVLLQDGVRSTVVDTEQVILDAVDRMRPGRPKYRHVVLIADRLWGLACDAVSKVVTVDSAQVRWRSQRRGQWLAGVLGNPPCAMIDPDAFATALALNEGARPGSLRK